jgi:hypothetical protein
MEEKLDTGDFSQVVEGVSGEVTLEGISGMVVLEQRVSDLKKSVQPENSGPTEEENRGILTYDDDQELKKGESGMQSSSSSDGGGKDD